MRGNIIKKSLMSFAFEKISRISLHCKLVPVQYREYEYVASLCKEATVGGRLERSRLQSGHCFVLCSKVGSVKYRVPFLTVCRSPIHCKFFLDNKSGETLVCSYNGLAAVVQSVGNTIHRINHYPVDSEGFV